MPSIYIEFSENSQPCLRFQVPSHQGADLGMAGGSWVRTGKGESRHMGGCCLARFCKSYTIFSQSDLKIFLKGDLETGIVTTCGAPHSPAAWYLRLCKTDPGSMWTQSLVKICSSNFCFRTRPGVLDAFASLWGTR